MNIRKRLKTGAKSYFDDDMSQNDFISDLQVSRNVYFKIMKDNDHFKMLLPKTRRNLKESLDYLGF